MVVMGESSREIPSHMKKKYYVVEEGIPMPSVSRSSREFPRTHASPNRFRKDVYPFSEMRVGDSFLIPRRDVVRGGVVASASRQWSVRRELGWVFSVRRVDDGDIRCWRIK